MTERESERDRDYPDGSVGRYVREQWGAAPPPRSRSSRSYIGPVQPALDHQPEGDIVPEPRSEPVEPSEGETTGPTAAVGRHAPPTGGFGNVLPPPAAASQQLPRPFPRPEVSSAVPPFASVPAATTAAPPAHPSSFPAPQHRPAPVWPPERLGDTPSRGAARWTDPGAVAAQEAQQARNPGGADLSSARLLRPARRLPQSGWRRMVYVLSGHLINPGESPADTRRRELTVRVNQPLLGCYKIAMVSLKGGVGKTTVTATLGATFSSLRGDRVVAVDANPDRGTLSQKIPLETSATVRNLLRDAQRVRRYTDVRAYTSQGPSRLEVLASEQDPAVSEAFSEDDYRRTVNLLEHFYNIVLTDCGTGLMHSAMYGVLGVADQLIVVSSGSIDGARSASATMDWLEAHGHGDLVANAVAVINCVHHSTGGVDLNRLAEHFEARCRHVVRIPFDAHLQEGAEVDLDRLQPGTRSALLELAAAVADAFEGAPTG
jgi:MinD-like ATPase involved in chromosome partitioning or flagellar assembly